MIYTLTTNPAIDMNVTAERLVPNVVSRTANPVYTPNGKGLNVSFTLHHFGVDSTILGFFGGFSGRYIVDGAREKGCEVKPVWVDGITRINTFISLMDGSGDEYKLPTAGCPVPRAQQLEMLELLRTLPDLDVLVISGSLSPQIDPSFYDEIIDVLEGRGAEFVLDISHPCLAHLIERGPLLIKPNDEELGQIFGIGVADESEIPDALREICSRGAKNVLLTMGGNGAFFTDGEKVWRASAVKVDVLSATCAGDATLAAFLSRWFASRETVEASLRRAMATGANVAMCAGLGDFALVDELEGRVAIERIVWNPSRLAHGDQQ